MGYHHCPIEPSDWSHGPADEPEMLERCPKCHQEAEDQGDGTWKCTDCDWTGNEPEWVEPSDPEPDMSDFV